MSLREDWRAAVLAIALFVLGFYASVIFTGHTLIPVHTAGFVPASMQDSNGGGPIQTFTRDPGGTIASDVAALSYLKKSWELGSVPLWNPFQGLGQPFAAMSPAAAFYPPNLIYYFLEPKYSDLLQLFQLALGAVFVLLFVRLSTGSTAAGAAAGFAFVCSGFFVVFAPTISIISTAIWIPFCLYATERAFRRSHDLRSAILLAIGLYGLATGGHVSFSIFGIVALTIYAGVRVSLQPPAWRFGGARNVATGVLIGGLCAAPHWLLVADYVLSTKELTSDIRSGSYALSALPQLFIPYVYGWLNDTSAFGIQSASLGDYWGMGWFTPPVAFLALLGLASFKNKEDSAVIAIATVGLLFSLWAFGVPPLSWLSDMPMTGRLQVGYKMAVPAISAAILAGVGFGYLRNSGGNRLTFISVIWVVIMITMAVIALNTTPVQLASMWAHPDSREILQGGLIPGLAWAVLFPAALIIRRRKCRDANFAFVTVLAIFLSSITYLPFYDPTIAPVLRLGGAAAFPALLMLESLSATRAWTSVVPASATIVRTTVLLLLAGGSAYVSRLPDRGERLEEPEFLKSLDVHSTSTGRVYGVGGFLHPNLSSHAEIRSMNYLQAILPPTTVGFVKTRLDEGQFWPHLVGDANYSEYYGSRFAPWNQLRIYRRFWDYVGVRYVVGRDLQMDARETQAARFRPADAGAIPDQWASLTPSGILESTVDCGLGPVSMLWVTIEAAESRDAPGIHIGAYEGETLIAESTSYGHYQTKGHERPFLLNRRICTDDAVDVRLRMRLLGGDASAQRVRNDASGFFFRTTLIDRPDPLFTELNFEWPERGQVLKPIQERDQSMEVRPMDRLELLAFKCSEHDVAGVRIWAPSTPYEGLSNVRLRIMDAEGKIRTESRAAWVYSDSFNLLLPTPEGTCRESGEELIGTLALEDHGKMTTFGRYDEGGNLQFTVLEQSDEQFEMLEAEGPFADNVWVNHQARAVAYVAPRFRQSGSATDALQDFSTSPDLYRTAFSDNAHSACPDAEVGSKGNTSIIDSIRIRPNSVEIEVRAATAGTLVLADAYYPGWTAKINGVSRELFRVNGAFRGVCIPAPGVHTVVMSYWPRLMTAGVIMALIGFMACIAVIWTTRRRPGRRNAESNDQDSGRVRQERASQ